jgi:hypothetical protein
VAGAISLATRLHLGEVMVLLAMFLGAVLPILAPLARLIGILLEGRLFGTLVPLVVVDELRRLRR